MTALLPRARQSQGTTALVTCRVLHTSDQVQPAVHTLPLLRATANECCRRQAVSTRRRLNLLLSFFVFITATSTNFHTLFRFSFRFYCITFSSSCCIYFSSIQHFHLAVDTARPAELSPTPESPRSNDRTTNNYPEYSDTMPKKGPMVEVEVKVPDKYSVILPTYNERRNLPIITWLLNRTFTDASVSRHLTSQLDMSTASNCNRTSLK